MDNSTSSGTYQPWVVTGVSRVTVVPAAVMATASVKVSTMNRGSLPSLLTRRNLMSLMGGVHVPDKQLMSTEAAKPSLCSNGEIVLETAEIWNNDAAGSTVAGIVGKTRKSWS